MSRILILKEAPYGSREESPQMTELMNGNYAGKPEACTICGGSPVVAGARYRNPLGNVDFTHHVCEPCADQYDIMHSSDKYKGEPMDIAMRLLKERVSPEAKRHKLEYDKKYESSPERVKYREELNRERRRRHIMGQGGPDMSHTSQHTIVPEDPHTNRARHFKDKGTLL